MINTVQIKKQQLEKGFFTIGSGTDVILVMGSCRVVNIVTYLSEWSAANGNRFTVHAIDPFSFNWDINEQRTDYDAILKNMEAHSGLLAMLKTVDVFVHEYYQNSGMFNVNRDGGKNIYQFGLNPSMDICIPNFNDYFILASDIVSFDTNIRKEAIQDYNVLGQLSDSTKKAIIQKYYGNLNKFYSVCEKSDLPELKDVFAEYYRERRMFWSFNHTSKHFTIALFKIMNAKYLKLDLSKGFNEDHEDIFANNYTKLTDFDKEWLGINWDEPAIPLKDKLF